jgi:2-methylcitrate dehydratase PrpD
MQALMQRIRITADAGLTHYHQCVVRGLDAAGGELFAHRVSSPKGAPGNPMSEDDVRGKVRTLIAGHLPPQRIERFLAGIDELERSPDCGWIVRSFL